MTLYATDLDGTLLRPDKSVSDDTAELLNKLIDAGVQITFATARSYSSASPLLKKLRFRCPAVTFNGVFVVDPKDGRHIAENVFGEASLKVAVDYFNSNSLAPLVYSYIDGRERVSYLEDRIDDVYGYVSVRTHDKRLRAVKTREELFAGRVFYFTLLDPKTDIAELDAVFSSENGFAVNFMPDTYNKDELWYEIFSKDACKAGALFRVMELVKADRLVCFGDNSNDISMITAADVGVAVGNSCEELKKAADIVIGSNDEDAVARYIANESGGALTEEKPVETLTDAERFEKAVEAGMNRIVGMHGSVGTQKEKLIHAVLKNYYAPYSDEQEIRIGKYFADAVNEDGIFEIQTRQLYRLREKLEAFTSASRVTIVYPMEVSTRTVYVDSDTGEVVSETPFRRCCRKLLLFEELYSVREFLSNDRLGIIVAKLKTERRILTKGGKPIDLRSSRARKKAQITRIPLELEEELRIALPQGLRVFLPEGLPESFTKADFCKAAKESKASLRLEVLRAAGIITQVGKEGRRYLYKLSEGTQNDD